MYNILVCDDDREIVKAIEIYLKEEGYNVIKAYDGRQAMDLLNKMEIHLLLIDVMMPVLDGVRATMKIRETNGVPIIILSAKSEAVSYTHLYCLCSLLWLKRYAVPNSTGVW